MSCSDDVIVRGDFDVPALHLVRSYQGDGVKRGVNTLFLSVPRWTGFSATAGATSGSTKSAWACPAKWQRPRTTSAWTAPRKRSGTPRASPWWRWWRRAWRCCRRLCAAAGRAHLRPRGPRRLTSSRQRRHHRLRRAVSPRTAKQKQ